MTTISNNDIARTVYLISKDQNQSEQINISKKVVKFLSRKRLLSKSSMILSQLQKIINQEESRIIAKISSVNKLNNQTKISIEQILKKRYSTREIFLEESLDDRLLGGIKVEINNEVIDLSIKNRIEKLQEYLTKSI